MKPIGDFLCKLLCLTLAFTCSDAAVLQHRALASFRSIAEAPNVAEKSAADLEQSIMSVLKAPNEGGIGGAVATMRGMVDDMLPKVYNAHNLSQANLDALYAAFGNCPSASLKAELIASLQTTSQTHKTCRDTEGNKATEAKTCTDLQAAHDSTRDAACKAVSNLKRDPNVEANVCHSSDEEYGAWIRRIADWSTGLANGYQVAEWSCGNATSVADATRQRCLPLVDEGEKAKSTCDAAQDELERATCSAATMLGTLCEERSLCFTAALSSLNAALPGIQKLEKIRKAEYRALKRMDCLLSTSNFADCKPGEREIEVCGNKTWDTSVLNLTYGGIPDEGSCGTTTFAAPCSTAYIAQEYGALPSSAPAKDCSVCAVPSSYSNFGIVNFRQRCQHDPNWIYVLDYSDNRTTDDIPDDKNVIEAGFDNENAYFLGNDALNRLNISRAEMCFLSSTVYFEDQCQWSCREITDSNWGGTSNTFDGMNTDLKKIIVGLSGQSPSPDREYYVTGIPAPVATFQGDLSHVGWSCKGMTGIYNFGTGFHTRGYGLTLRGNRWQGGWAANQEIGWPSNDKCRFRRSIDPDTFQIRVKLS